MRKVLAVLLISGATMLATPSAFATCAPSSIPMGHQLSNFVCRDGSEVAAFAWQANAPTVNSNLENIACEAVDGVRCLVDSAGQRGDGNVTIETDWGNSSVLGCPLGQRVMLSVRCNDGSGLIVSLGAETFNRNAMYLLETAHPNDFSPLVADGKPFVNNATNNTDGTVTLALRFPTQVTVHSDCDVGSFGADQGGCVDGFQPDTKGTIGRVLTSQQQCKDASGADIPPRTDRSLWTPNAVVPDAAGNVVLTVLRATAPNTCLFVGATTNILGLESAAITTFVAVGGPGAASPVAQRVRAEQAQGNIRVRWETDIEINLAGFNILSEGKKGTVQVNEALIAATGNGGRANYTALVARSKFQGSRTVIIESVLTDGTKLRSAPANF